MLSHSHTQEVHERRVDVELGPGLRSARRRNVLLAVATVQRPTSNVRVRRVRRGARPSLFSPSRQAAVEAFRNSCATASPRVEFPGRRAKAWPHTPTPVTSWFGVTLMVLCYCAAQRFHTASTAPRRPTLQTLMSQLLTSLIVSGHAASMACRSNAAPSRHCV